MSVVTENDGVSDEASAAQLPAAQPNALSAVGHEESVVDESKLEPESLETAESREDELECSKMSLKNSRMPKVNSRAACCAGMAVPRLQRESACIIQKKGGVLPDTSHKG